MIDFVLLVLIFFVAYTQDSDKGLLAAFVVGLLTGLAPLYLLLVMLELFVKEKFSLNWGWMLILVVLGQVVSIYARLFLS